MNYEAIVIGLSSGGMNAMKLLFSTLPANFKIPIILVQHLGAHSDGQWISILNSTSELRIKEADEKERIESGTIYIAPANYHLLIEKDRTFSLTIDEKINYARPSIDVLFESAAEVYQNKLIGIILTGSNHDGSRGLKTIKKHGGLTIAEDPKSAEAAFMPKSAIKFVKPDYILPLEEITLFLIALNDKLKLQSS